MTYHTTLVKVIAKAGKPLPLPFESVLTRASVREQRGTGKSSRPHVRVLSNRRAARNHKVIYRFTITHYKAE